MAAGGLAASPGLCALAGAPFAAAAPALGLLLVAGCLQHLGWQCSNTLLANHRDGAYAFAFAGSAALQFALLAMLTVAGPLDAADAAMLAATATALAHGAYATFSLAVTRATWRGNLPRAWQALLLAALTAAAAIAPARLASEGTWRLALQLAAGGAAFACGLWWLELRGRWRRVGDGLADASGLRA
jgi:hypothetical protein